MLWAPELLEPRTCTVRSAEWAGEFMDNLRRKNEFLSAQTGDARALIYNKADRHPVTQLPSLPSPAMRQAEGETAPGWWFHEFELVWRPFIQRFCRQKKVTLLEFEQAASQVPGLTHIEKTIAISAFRQQLENGLLPAPNTTAFRSERSLFAV
jgi:hypothetical protein